MSTRNLQFLPVLLTIAAAALGGFSAACSSSSGPCQGSECGSNSMGSGNFTPGPFPHSATSLDGPRCYIGGVNIALFLNAPFTDPDPPAPVRRPDPLRVYWSVCNSGLTDAAPQPESYTLTPQLKVSPTETVDLPSTTYSIPALAHCTCDVQSRLFQNELDPGSYTFRLAGTVQGTVDRNISP